MDELRKRRPGSDGDTSLQSLPLLSTTHEVGYESSADLIAVQQLNDARKLLLDSSELPANHDFRKRANEADGSLLPVQPNGTPRKAYQPHNIPRPRLRRDKEAASYFLDRRRLVNMWNGSWGREEDWAAWDATKDKMEANFGAYNLVEWPPLVGLKTKGQKNHGKKRKRTREVGSSKACKRQRLSEDSVESMFVSPLLQFPTPDEILAATPPDGVALGQLVETFFGCADYDIERFCVMLHELGYVDNGVFTAVKLGVGQHKRIASANFGDIPIDPVLLNMSLGNACIRAARMET